MAQRREACSGVRNGSGVLRRTAGAVSRSLRTAETWHEQTDQDGCCRVCSVEVGWRFLRGDPAVRADLLALGSLLSTRGVCAACRSLRHGHVCFFVCGRWDVGGRGAAVACGGAEGAGLERAHAANHAGVGVWRGARAGWRRYRSKVESQASPFSEQRGDGTMGVPAGLRGVAPPSPPTHARRSGPRRRFDFARR